MRRSQRRVAWLILALLVLLVFGFCGWAVRAVYVGQFAPLMQG